MKIEAQLRISLFLICLNLFLAIVLNYPYQFSELFKSETGSSALAVVINLTIFFIFFLIGSIWISKIFLRIEHVRFQLLVYEGKTIQFNEIQNIASQNQIEYMKRKNILVYSVMDNEQVLFEQIKRSRRDRLYSYLSDRFSFTVPPAPENNFTSPEKIFYNPKKEGLIALGLLTFQTAFLTLLYIMQNRGPDEITTYDLDLIVKYLFLYGGLFILPVLILLMIRKQGLSTIKCQKKGFKLSLCGGLIAIFCFMWLGYNVSVLLYFVIAIVILYSWYKEELKHTRTARMIVNLIQSQQFITGVILLSAFGIIIFTLIGGTLRTGEILLSYSGVIGIIVTLVQVGGEEIAFRGYIQTRLVDALDEKQGILITAILFASMHIPILIYSAIDRENSLFSIFPIFIGLFLFSMVIGYITFRTDNLVAAILLHGTNNFFI